MDPMKFLELQRQMKENNNDVADFLNGISDFKKDVANKYDKLKAQSTNTCENLPPVRHSLLKKKKVRKEKKNIDSVKEKKQVRIKSSDYKAWDKFDVDKAVEEVDKSSSENGETADSTDDEWEEFRRKKLADEAKEEGNRQFKLQKFDLAIEQYTKCVMLSPENPVGYLNRAMAQLKLENFAAAENDCSIALSIDKKLSKGYYRRAIARKHLSKWQEAVADLRQLLELEPGNTMAQQELRALQPSVVLPMVEDVDIRVNRNFRRIPITEVGSLDNKQSASEKTPRLPPTILSEPSNWYQMERDLRELCPSTYEVNEAAVEYLCRLSPSKYSTVIGQNLDTACLSRLLMAMRKSQILNPDGIAERLSCLAQLPRFDVAWMLSSDEDRANSLHLLTKLPESDISKRLRTLFR